MGYLALLLIVMWAHDVPGRVTTDAWDAFVRRVDATPLPARGTLRLSRVAWDDAGHVVMLWLDGMHLSTDEFRLLARFPHLQKLGLSQSNVTDPDLRNLEGLEHLRTLTLNRTAITDRAIRSIKKLKALDTLCLGGVGYSRKRR
jgi:hypothetical protein